MRIRAIEGNVLDLAELGNRCLRAAVQRNMVCFPAQAPVFIRQSRMDIQWKIAVLYFVQGWSMDQIAQRYGVKRQRAGQIITAWRKCAVKQGYLQVIEPEADRAQRRAELSVPLEPRIVEEHAPALAC